MPRVANLSRFPWDEWGQQLIDSPTRALLFDSSDFGEMTPRTFRTHAMKELKHLGVKVTLRLDEVLVVLDA